MTYKPGKRESAKSPSTNNQKRLIRLAGKAALDPFVLALVLAILLARFWPEPGLHEGTFSISNLANWGVSFIFFFYGLRQEPEKLKTGLRNWKLHLLIQLTTFVFFPLLGLSGLHLFQTPETAALWLGIFFLSALPSTVSSSVVMVSIAGGNLPAAIFNASLSSMMGVFITPLWMGVFLNTSSANFDLSEVFGKLIIQVVVPVVLGLLLHKRFGETANKYRKQMRYFDQAIILMIVYSSFSESFSQNMFSGFSAPDVLLLGVGMIGLFLLVFYLVKLFSNLMHFSREDRVTAIFCGSKKSLVHGTVMAKVLFVNALNLGVLLLPIMLYHALQLIIASVIAQHEATKQ